MIDALDVGVRALIEGSGNVAQPPSRNPRYFTLGELLADEVLLRPPTPLVAPFLMRGRVTLLSGREKTGKSTLAACAVASLTRGERFLDQDLAPCNVLWYALDESKPNAVARFQRLGADPDRLTLCFDVPTGRSLAAALVSRDYALVVADTINEIAGGISLNKGEEIIPVLRPLVEALRDADVSGCFLGHTSKSRGEYMGDVRIGGLFDGVIALKEVSAALPTISPDLALEDDDGGDDCRRVLAGKTRWGAKFRLRLEYAVGRYVLGAGPGPLGLRILTAVAGEEAPSASSTARELGVRKDRAIKEVAALKAADLLANQAGPLVLTDAGQLCVEVGALPQGYVSTA